MSAGRRALSMKVRLCAVAALAFAAAPARSEPIIPANDAVVLERLPAASPARALAPLRAAVKEDPRDLRSTLDLAQSYLQIGRATSDPRFASYAQATLGPWLQRPDPPAPVLVLAASALQSSHRFGEALQMLDRALVLEPHNAQAWLTKATILQVRGEFDAARTACRRLPQSADQMITLTCLASVDSLTGRLELSYRALDRMVSADGNAASNVQAWVSGQLADMAVRLRDFTAAERHFTSALRLDPDEPYLKAAYSDLLLLENRHEEVIELLRDGAAHDVLLLRLAIAARRAQARDAPRWARLFEARRQAVRKDDNPHAREHARFLLDVLDQPREALTLARKNWGEQREPADVQIYLRAARSAGSAEDERVVQEWIQETGYEDETLHPPYGQGRDRRRAAASTDGASISEARDPPRSVLNGDSSTPSPAPRGRVEAGAFERPRSVRL